MTRKDALARKILRIVRRSRDMLPIDRLAERQDRARRIAGYAVADRVVIRSGGTDCDGYRSEYLTILPATVMHFEGYRARQELDAEGPTFCYLVEGTRKRFEQAHDYLLPTLTGFDFEAFRA